MKVISINDRMYDRNIYFVFNCDAKQLERWLYLTHGVKQDADGMRNMAAGYLKTTTKKDRPLHLIWQPKMDWTIYDQECLAHEIFHLVFGVMSELDIEYSKEGEEAFAYYYSHIFGAFWNKLKPVKKKKGASHATVRKKANH